MEKWYKNLYRRNLVDMHIADWNDEFLSKFDVDDYYNNLVKGKVQAPMIYLHAHTGLCHYPTKTGSMHKCLQSDPYKVKRLIDKCRSNGMKVVGYYSLIFNNAEADKHPEWCLITGEGKKFTEHGLRYGLCCPNNAEYREFVKSQIKEISEIFELDAIFYDMPYWETPCYCDACKKAHGEAPKQVDWHDEKWKKFNRARQVEMGDFVKFVKEVTEEYMPDVTIEFNYAAVMNMFWQGGSTELINDGCEFASGDLYGDIYSQSFACKYYRSITKNEPFEHMTSRADPNLRDHTVLKSEKRLSHEVLLTAAHHGASLIIDAIDPRGTLDGRVYDRLGKVFEKQIPHEKFFYGTPVEDVAVYFDTTAQFNSNGYEFNNNTAGVKTCKHLIKKHYLVNVVHNRTTDLEKYKMIFAPTLEDFDNDFVYKLMEYVKNGGVLYLSSVSESRLMKEFFGAELKGFTDYDFNYIAPNLDGEKYFAEFNKDYPLPVKYKLPIYDVKKGKILATVTTPYTNPSDHTKFSSIHSNPPGIATDISAAAMVDYGKGKVFWSSAALEFDDRDAFTEIIGSIADSFVYDKSICATAGEDIEITLFKDDEDYIMHLIDYTHTDVKRYATVKVKADKAPKSVKYAIGEENIPFTFENGYVNFTVNFILFETIGITFE